MNISIRRSSLADLDLLQCIEQAAFPFFQQSSRRTLRLSLTSPFQTVWIAEVKHGTVIKSAGHLILHLHKRTLRIFSIAVLPEYQGKGVGFTLIKFAENYALSHNYDRISLEAEADNRALVRWYSNLGYQSVELIPDYYQENKDALRMAFQLPHTLENNRISNLIVVNSPSNWKLRLENVQVVSARKFTSDSGVYSRKNLRVFNLCNSYRYQSLGYYVSLLASARDQRVIPNVTTIRDMKDGQVIRSLTNEINELLQTALKGVSGKKLELDIYFGHTMETEFAHLAQQIYQLFEAPLIKVFFVKNEEWEIRRVQPLSMDKTEAGNHASVQEFATKYFQARRFHRKKMKAYKYDLAILINPKEVHPPSNKKALKLFKSAAERENVYLEFITREDINRISEFDALFIRETTNVNDHTYQFARKAYAEGLVVIDDPWSVLRCSNKIYLNERLRNNNLNTPATHVFYKGNISQRALANLHYPLILKQPDSAFSLGVLKVENQEELKSAFNKLFRKSDLIIGQEYLPSDFDWRIGVLDNLPLFACKYYMAKGHWQIYDWKSKEKDPSGDSETLSMDEVPRKILQAATKAASLIGDGLYGVDIKEIEGKPYVIEVNDNPNIDAGVEDLKLGNELYVRIIQSFKTRIEMSRNIARFVSIEPD